MRFNTLHHIHKMLQNCWRKSILNTQNPGASRGGVRHYLDPLEILSDPQTPQRLSPPLTQNHGFAPVRGINFSSFHDFSIAVISSFFPPQEWVYASFKHLWQTCYFCFSCLFCWVCSRLKYGWNICCW
jgi:hypothetical protein